MFKLLMMGFIMIMMIYYLTVLLHVAGFQMFRRKKLSFPIGLVPFYYWFKRKNFQI